MCVSWLITFIACTAYIIIFASPPTFGLFKGFFLSHAIMCA
jgi:hypothetical protein